MRTARHANPVNQKKYKIIEMYKRITTCHVKMLIDGKGPPLLSFSKTMKMITHVPAIGQTWLTRSLPVCGVFLIKQEYFYPSAVMVLCSMLQTWFEVENCEIDLCQYGEQTINFTTGPSTLSWSSKACSMPLVLKLVVVMTFHVNLGRHWIGVNWNHEHMNWTTMHSLALSMDMHTIASVKLISLQHMLKGWGSRIWKAVSTSFQSRIHLHHPSIMLVCFIASRKS